MVDEMKQIMEAYIDDKAPMTIDDLTECLEVHFDQCSEDLVIFEKPFDFKKLCGEKSGELFTTQADIIYGDTREFELLYTFDEFLSICHAYFAVDGYELTRFEDCDATYETNDNGDIKIRNITDYSTFVLDYCDMGVDGSNDPDVDMAYFQFEKETGCGLDDLKDRWFNVVHGNVLFI